MNFTCLQENLLKGLQIARQSSTKQSMLPILQNYLLEEREGSLILTTTNLEISIKTYIRGKQEGKGKITIPQDKLLNYIKNLPQDKIEISLEENTLNVKSGNEFKAKFNGMDANDFPEIPNIESKLDINLSTQDLKEAFKMTINSLPKNDFRPEISGVLLMEKEGKLFFVGTDGFRLAEKKISNVNLTSTNFQFIIPAKTVQECNRILDLVDDEDVKLSFNDNQMSMILSSVELTSKLIEGKYPQYEGLIPTSFEKSFSVDKNSLIQAIRLSSVFSDDNIHDVKFYLVNNQTLEIQSETDSYGENKTQITCQLTGEADFIINFNYSFIMDGLSLIKGDLIKFFLNETDSPVIMKGEDSEQFFYLVMPIRG